MALLVILYMFECEGIVRCKILLYQTFKETLKFHCFFSNVIFFSKTFHNQFLQHLALSMCFAIYSANCDRKCKKKIYMFNFEYAEGIDSEMLHPRMLQHLKKIMQF